MRQVPVSGSPPWEPAPRPTSELPWASISAPPAIPGQRADVGPARVSPEAIWHPAPPQVSAAPGSLFAPIPRNPPGPRPAPDGSGSEDGGRADTGSRPIYVWNPAASTDSFPAVGPDLDRG